MIKLHDCNDLHPVRFNSKRLHKHENISFRLIKLMNVRTKPVKGDRKLNTIRLIIVRLFTWQCMSVIL